MGLQNAVFCSSSRYIEAKDFLNGILQKFNVFASFDTDVDSIHKEDVEKRLQVYTELKDAIEDGKIVGKTRDLSDYQYLFDDSWSDSDKISAYTLLVKSHIEQLKREEELHKESMLLQANKGLTDKADIVSLDIERQLEERVNRVEQNGLCYELNGVPVSRHKFLRVWTSMMNAYDAMSPTEKSGCDMRKNALYALTYNSAYKPSELDSIKEFVNQMNIEGGRGAK